ncbi:MAG: deoxyribodipyrimidine photo-lyase [Pseudomonadota bacterium]
MQSILFWFRRDLRANDNAGLCQALKSAKKVHCVFVFDREILDALPTKSDRRVEFIWESVVALRLALREKGGDLIVRYGHATPTIPSLAKDLAVDAVFTNSDYEPGAISRDSKVAATLQAQNITFESFKDTVIFEKDEVLTLAGKPFSVFTPYKNAWLKKIDESHLQPFPVEQYQDRLAAPVASLGADTLPSLESLGFVRTNILSMVTCGPAGAAALRDDFIGRMAEYKDTRDFPSIRGVSYLSIHNRFGTISIRELATIAYAETLKRKNIGAEAWLAELIWREFYVQILWHNPHVVTRAYKPDYAALNWQNDPELFSAWCQARTGYPIIDAAMRQINQTGYMHNRLRMIVASFLTKDLLVDWRWGEKYFADNLNDFDLSANNGGWQWAASTGCDAQPYFRIFNPTTQSERFDPQGRFIRKYLPELQNVPDKYIHAPWTLPQIEAQARNFVIGRDYLLPIVDHAVQRDKALAMFKAARG